MIDTATTRDAFASKNHRLLLLFWSQCVFLASFSQFRSWNKKDKNWSEDKSYVPVCVLLCPGTQLLAEHQPLHSVLLPVHVVRLERLSLELGELRLLLRQGDVGQPMERLCLCLIKFWYDPQSIDAVSSDGEPRVQAGEADISIISSRYHSGNDVSAWLPSHHSCPQVFAAGPPDDSPQILAGRSPGDLLARHAHWPLAVTLLPRAQLDGRYKQSHPVFGNISRKLYCIVELSSLLEIPFFLSVGSFPLTPSSSISMFNVRHFCLKDNFLLSTNHPAIFNLI